ncbi:alpha/beta hydrolase [Trueperella pecoris]|uniref:alpha/beta hydrolase n=1 Tax=Trueperella pecoris TaxID=2733571 RepID=UPI00186B59A2|nr:alpha/beta fold hydrolase [Trueperella pecoris]QOQ38116.1 alpha/beta fold hydrolase [Trueperella pecoris]QTG75277.1 alpha/beta fold hydrolase [Trueperella pecoris]
MASHGISYSVSGCEVKGVIVALHGVTDNAASLSDLARQWKDEWKVYLVDTLGHGLSRSFDDTELADPLRAIAAAVRSVVIEAARQSVSRKVVLMGHSLGGAVACAIANDVPEVIQALVLEDPALLTDGQWELYRGSAGDLVKRQELVTDHVGEAITELMKVYTAWPASEYGAWAQGKTQVDRRFVATGVVGMRGREVLAGLSVPTLLVTGDQSDVLFGREGQSELESLGNPHISSVLISDASHTVRRDQSEEFYRVVGEFLRRYGQRPLSPTPYIAAELQPVIDATPEQNAEDYLAMRRRGEELLADVRPADGVTVEEVHLGGQTGDDRQADSSDEAFTLRCLRSGAEPRAVVLSIHGGGYIAGAARYDDARNSELIEVFGGAVVASPDYRLSPEWPWPAAATDCVRSLHYLSRAYPGLPLYIYGDSAGAGLAQQALAIIAASGQGPDVDRIVLLEPCLEPGMVTRSFDTYRDGPIWTLEASSVAWRHYMGASDAVPPYVPSRAAASAMPPTFLVVNPADPLRDEGMRFAQDLADAGVAVELHMYSGTFHGALSVPGTSTWERVKDDIRAFLATPITSSHFSLGKDPS